MINKISMANIAPKCAKVRNASSEALSRTHYLKFLKENNKFYDSINKAEYYLNDCSLKAIPQFIKSLFIFVKMSIENDKSAYYCKK